MTQPIYKTMDGNEAAAYVSYPFTEVATIYPITPATPMAEHIDEWSAQGRKNLFGQSVRVIEMESEQGAAGAMQGSLEAGALTTSYTSSQGLLLMVPPMYRISGMLLPGVIHVAARALTTHAISIFGDHSDVMACRQTGFAMLSSGSVQEVMDLGGIAHLAALKGRVPFLHFFDGFRTSHEIQKVEVMPYEVFDQLMDRKAVQEFRKRALNPEHPVLRATNQNPDIHFQNREAANPYYEALPDIVAGYMEDITRITGRMYHPFTYYGAEDARHIIIAMGSVSGTIRETIDYLNSRGAGLGFIQVYLYRPFSARYLLAALPESAEIVTVMDRTKEPGSFGEPLFEDVSAVIYESRRPVQVLACRYGLASKDLTPAGILAVYDNMKKEHPENHFTVGITDDVTRHSIPVGAPLDAAPKGTVSCKFWGIGADGTVGANKNTIKIIGDYTDMYVQAYFEYDAKKSGGVTRSHMRFGTQPIQSSYLVTTADFVACHASSYISRYDIVSEIKEGGTFLLNCSWKGKELEQHIPAGVLRTIARNHIHFFTIDATKIAREIGLGNRTNTVLQAAFFKLSGVLDAEKATEYMKDAIKKTYGAKGDKIVSMNCQAVDRGISDVTEVAVPDSWQNLSDDVSESVAATGYLKDILLPVNNLKGEELPVSTFSGMYTDGTVPTGTAKYEKRGVAAFVPVWNPDKCIQCNQCSLVCPHAAIRPFLLDRQEMAQAPYETRQAHGKGMEPYQFRIQVSVLDCTGCESCVNTCPAKEKALSMQPLETQRQEAENWMFSMDLKDKPNPVSKYTVRGSQFEQPLIEFSGACAGCGETPYLKLVTQLYGDRMILAEATGCMLAWGSSAPAIPYTKNSKGRGPAVSNSLFENNAEYGYGMFLAVSQQRERLLDRAQELVTSGIGGELQEALQVWIEGYNESDGTFERAEAVIAAARNAGDTGRLFLEHQDQLSKKSVWIFGGDGWSYDIGYGGLDHVLAQGQDVNVLVVDTEVYSNTGGQASKSTQISAVAQLAVSGKKTGKKELGLMETQYGNVYVAQIAMGADQNQAIKAIKEAESYHGPSLIIAYAPCINHGILKGMGQSQLEEKLAVQSGYWHLYRYDPRRAEAGQNPFQLDSKEPSKDFSEFLKGENRFASLNRTFPEQYEKLSVQAGIAARAKYEKYKKLAEE